MFSNDRNIDNIGQLVEVVKHYIGLQSEYVKLDVIDKIVRLFTVIAIAAAFALLLLLALIYLSFALAYALQPALGSVGAFGLVAGVYIFILILFVAFRKAWIERPLVRFLASLLMSK
uniref:Phage holin family protein n=1 Tax=Prevotella sp. GTC17253 TaxID=3236793 RepID=A0AB33IRR0_9BACT